MARQTSKQPYLWITLIVIFLAAAIWYYVKSTDVSTNSNKPTVYSNSDLRRQTDSLTKQAIEFETTRIEENEALSAQNIIIKTFDDTGEISSTKAAKARILLIKFLVSPNALARTGKHEVYLIVSDENRNVLDTSNDKRIFVIDDRLQYTTKTSIDFTNQEQQYSVEWRNPENFTAQTYDVALYADGHLMGRKEFTLE